LFDLQVDGFPMYSGRRYKVTTG